MEAIPVKCTKRLLILHVCVGMTPLEGRGSARPPDGHSSLYLTNELFNTALSPASKRFYNLLSSVKQGSP